jgi:hypothetical protein
MTEDEVVRPVGTTGLDPDPGSRCHGRHRRSDVVLQRPTS